MSKIRLFLLRLSASFRRRRAEAELGREIDAHLQLLEEKFVADGMTPEQARSAARRAFGNIEHTKELQRDARSFRWLTGWSMELRLGVRMLVRYPGLTVVGGLAMALAILVGAGVFELVKRATDPVLPLPDGQDIIGLTFWDRRESDPKPATSYDFLQWRQELTTLQDIGAFRLVEQNLAADGRVAEPMMVAQISPAAFRMTRVPPLLGRTLVEADENPGSPAVVVLGHRLWQTRFGGDRAVVGRIARLGGVQTTVVGVMPEGFRFPVDDNLWTPLRSGELVREPGHDALKVFGRLAPGATLREAQAEVALVTARTTASFPDRYAQLTPQVLPFANSIIWLPPDLFVQAGVRSINVFAVLLLIVICGNVALLMLTRTATREREILVRTALGATRGRILAQLVVEALALATLAAALGLTATSVLLKTAADMLGAGSERWPFWLDAGLSPATVGYVGALTFLAAIIVGVLPGLKIIGRGTTGDSDRLRQSTAGAGGLRMGKVWTGLVVTQIAATVVFTATAYVVHRQASYLASEKAVFPAEKYLSVRLEMESEGAAENTVPVRRAQNFAAAVTEPERRLANEAAVGGVTVADQLPLMATTTHRAIEVSNSMFVEGILGGRNAVGQRIRYESVEPVKPGPWLEIIGVVRDLVPDAGAPLNLDTPWRPRVYHCLRASQGSGPLYLGVRARTDPQSLGPMLRRVAGDVSPMLQLHDILPLDHAVGTDTRFWRGFANVFISGSAIVLFLSLAGIYSVTSFTVARRTREIGLRVALGASAPRIMIDIFRRPLLQVAAGVMTGCALLAVVTFTRSGSGVATARQAALLVAYGIAVMGVGALACIGPALRALRIDPVEALREDV